MVGIWYFTNNNKNNMESWSFENPTQSKNKSHPPQQNFFRTCFHTNSLWVCGRGDPWKTAHLASVWFLDFCFPFLPGRPQIRWWIFFAMIYHFVLGFFPTEPYRNNHKYIPCAVVPVSPRGQQWRQLFLRAPPGIAKSSRAVDLGVNVFSRKNVVGSYFLLQYNSDFF